MRDTRPNADPRRPAPPPDGEGGLGGTLAQHRALEGAREASASVVSGNLLSTTGPLAELTSAQRRGVLDEVRRTLIAKKGAGVVFEAVVVAQLQEASERYGIELSARLSTAANNPRTDVTVVWRGVELELQLKAGSDPYLRAAVRAREEGIILLVPSDAKGAGARTALTFGDVTVETPTRSELRESADVTLNRLSRGESALNLLDVAKQSISNALIDGLVAGIADLALQALTKPDDPIDWARTAKLVARSGATSAASSFLAAAHTGAALQVGTRAVDATASLRAGRAAACVVPHAIDVAFDYARLTRGELAPRQFKRRVARHAGAATAEFVGFRFLARLASHLGPLGGLLVMLAGGLLLSYFGGKAGELLYDLLGDAAFPAMPEHERLPAPRMIDFASEGRQLSTRLSEETTRRTALAERRLCEERGCGRAHHARGMCKRHYQRWWRKNRDYLAEKRLRAAESRA